MDTKEDIIERLKAEDFLLFYWMWYLGWELTVILLLRGALGRCN